MAFKATPSNPSWEYARTVRRDHILIDQHEFTSHDVDGLFRKAKAIGEQKPFPNQRPTN